MTKIFYEDWNPSKKSLDIVEHANAILDEYRDEGYILTLRQLYYQFVARGLLENSDRSYKNLGVVINKARLAGMVSWTAIEDRNRQHRSYYFEEQPSNVVDNLGRFINFDYWARQDVYVEVWVEKEALGNIVSKACEPWQVPYLSCKGYLSASEAWRAGQRFKEKIQDGKDCFMLHLGDHDPSGIDMTRDNSSRLEMFSEYLDGVEVKRLALNMDQVEELKPPPNPAKLTDTRASDYIRRFGRTSWELDALTPSYLTDLIQTEIKSFVDPTMWQMVSDQEDEATRLLNKVGERWEDEILPLLESRGL